MSEEQPEVSKRYQVGDTLECQLEITATDNEYFYVQVKGTGWDVDYAPDQDELDEAFNPVYKKARIKEQMEELQKQLEALNNG